MSDACRENVWTTAFIEMCRLRLERVSGASGCNLPA
jgi:hypothetical protein